MTDLRTRALEAARYLRNLEAWMKARDYDMEAPGDLSPEIVADLLEELAARLEWRPISEAPGLYRPILAFLPGDWETPWEICVAFQKREGVFARNDDDHLIIEPTHFMLLPEPPSGDAP